MSYELFVSYAHADDRGERERSMRKKAVYSHADERGRWLKIHWGQPGLAWELLPLRKVALRRIDEGDRGGVLLGDQVSAPLLHIGQMLEVRELRRRSTSMFQRLYDAAPENADCACDLSVSFNKLGDLARSAGDPAAAHRFYQDGLEIAKRLYNAAPENADYARDLSVSFNNLGDLARSADDPAAARRFFQDGLDIAQRLCDAAPENADCARDLWISYWRMATLNEENLSNTDPRSYWLRAYQTLSCMKQRGMFTSVEDEGYLETITQKLGMS